MPPQPQQPTQGQGNQPPNPANSTTQVVTDGTYTFACQLPGCTFSTSGWPDKGAAVSRGAQHYNEHQTGQPMQALSDYEVSRYGRRVDNDHGRY